MVVESGGKHGDAFKEYEAIIIEYYEEHEDTIEEFRLMDEVI